MRITLKSSMVGRDFSHPVGATIEWPDVEAKRLIERGLAIKAPAARSRRGRKPRTTTAPAAETADLE